MGTRPAPINELGSPILIDDGTSALTESPAPGPVGLNAKRGGSKQAHGSIADQIVAYARQRLGTEVGDGECYTLVDRALRNAGAKSAEHYGTVTPDADYVWGTSVNRSELRPGDVIQFRDYSFDRTVDTNNPDGSGSTATDHQERPHHTAIVERIDGEAVVVLEQNSPEGAPVTRNRLFFRNSTTSNGNQTTTISVQGTFWFYRPEAN
jgi:cell wall-associated NlpC family hydrolase